MRSLICKRIKIHSHIIGFALSLASKQRLRATQKWPLGHRAVEVRINKIFAPEKRFNKGCLASLFPNTKESYSMAIQIKPLILIY